ncbi:uncharacterized protein LOC106644922 [Copidosoma floridanum]|uniref:uncharacterized protein LOC106644922 n=1 Tax=Copidosoma floridanum TaxID=29053 RepID=UPI0006C9459F|nr:uncharacterized protein LOC106644922 [Copidosoma floridanum]
MAALREIFLGGFSTTRITFFGTSFLSSNSAGYLQSQVRQYAARRGTREKARRNKIKKEVVKLTLADKIRRSKKDIIVKPAALRFGDHFLPEASDNVYFTKYYAVKKYSFEEALNCHRELLHPTILNGPKSMVLIFAELNFEGVKKNKPVEAFHKIVPVTHTFDHGEDRKILVFCKTEEQVAEALAAGAALAGGEDVVKLIVNGEISVHSYDTILAHPTMLPVILTIRGLLKKKHPSFKTGTLSNDIKQMIHSHMHGIKYTAKAYDQFPMYGKTTMAIGTLDMDIKQLEENFQDVLNSLMSAKPKRPGCFITRVTILCLPSPERFKIDISPYIKEEQTAEVPGHDALDEEDEEDSAAVALSV